MEDDWPWRYDTLSCGQQKRLQVACALWQRPDLLVMDEPTNHVDVPTREAVTAALARFKGVGLLISHDRALLDALCSQCLFMAAGQVTVRPGGYSQGRGQGELERKTALRQREQAKREKKRLAGEAQRRREEASRAAGMRSCRNLDPKDHSGKERVKLAVYTGKDGVAGKLSSRMESRLSRAEETLAQVKVEKRYDGDLWMRAEPSARKVLYRQPEMTLALGERQLLVPPLSIGNTDHIALTGPNGAGKTTLVSEVARRIDPDRAGARHPAGAHRRAVPRCAFSIGLPRFAQSGAGAGGGRGAQFRSRSLGGRRANEPGRDAQAHARPRDTR